ncbi:hypothetical protein SBA4_3810011 [Candidatus Sulfopaludibacter sp. SbA4]|nr:hypothetical protein SBA4_3810011 [Candidatus Sulfopaludibacter sp. SbA4]
MAGKVNCAQYVETPKTVTVVLAGFTQTVHRAADEVLDQLRPLCWRFAWASHFLQTAE